MTELSLLIIDDDEVVRQMLPAYFDEPGFRIAAVVSSGIEAMEVLRTTGVDVILTDIRMPDMTGIELTRELRKTASHIPVVGITSFDKDEYVVEMLRAGAAGIILKSARRDDLVRAVRLAAEGKTYVAPEIAGRLHPYLTPAAPEPRAPALTRRERQVLDLLLQGMSNQEIAGALTVSVAAVKKHVGALFLKFEVDSRLKLAIAALRR